MKVRSPKSIPHMTFNVRANPTQWTQILADEGTYYIAPDIDVISAGEWHHFCGGFSVKQMKTFIPIFCFL